MRQLNQQNVEMIRRVAGSLGHLKNDVVFVGGAIVDLLITEDLSPHVRPTKDVDVAIELASLREYHLLGEVLRELGFKEDRSSEVIHLCRWIIDNIRVDFIPTNKDILGFTNVWLKEAVGSSVWVDVEKDCQIRLITAPCFLATKFLAFSGRGNQDYMASQDMEDIIAVIDGCNNIIKEANLSSAGLREYLSQECRALSESESFLNYLHDYLIEEHRPTVILERIKALSKSG